MDLFELGRFLHSTAGIVVLATFWIAALAQKGGRVHRQAGRVYLISLIVVLTLSTLMVAGKALDGDPGVAIFLAFLISMVGTASWLMWFASRYRHEPDRLVGRTYRLLASWLIVSGAALFFLGVARQRPLMMLLPLLGVGFGGNMWRIARVPREGRWWLEHHMNGAMLNFIATHDSFIALGIGSVIPELRHGVGRMLVAAGVISIGIALRIWSQPRRNGLTALAVAQTAANPSPSIAP